MTNQEALHKLEVARDFYAWNGEDLEIVNLVIDILKNQNTNYLQAVKEIERLYEEAQGLTRKWDEYSKAAMEFKRYTDALLPEAWLA